eukprot:CAMPEP_0177535942 /NCGR_PEP_ID=MMETSP0369-20130122/56870_1 /TAXON_ID=447022 ORGANISM="Scrippsiella hangoei-like, Strain SHHI-4" /NCGR_SAMPLE_ID=MMETSP0369 /ASSEMBLY_ACC=CAM_ASM_000364 /LENGTH=81 /DNA_ID=CAMNT_0019018235 /DNA_START=29 /DNA_END=271 /DNA_ORIENTATION=+
MPGMETPGNVLDPSRKKAKYSEAMVVMLRTPSSDTTLNAASFTRWPAAPLVQAECPGATPLAVRARFCGGTAGSGGSGGSS